MKTCRVPAQECDETRIPEVLPIRKQQAPGFGLMEFVVACAVVAILVAMAFPAMQSLFRSARSSSCVSNLRQIGQAFHLYLADNNQELPQRFYPGSNPSTGYDELLLPYLNDGYQVFICPDLDPKSRPRKAGTPSYGMNWFYDNVSAYSVGDPSRTIFVAEAKGGRRGSHRADRDNRPPGQLAVDRHSGKANYLFFDGRVEALDYAETLKPVDLWGSDQGRHDMTPP